MGNTTNQLIVVFAIALLAGPITLKGGGVIDSVEILKSWRPIKDKMWVSRG